jgi:hypothetical protein
MKAAKTFSSLLKTGDGKTAVHLTFLSTFFELHICGIKWKSKKKFSG